MQAERCRGRDLLLYTAELPLCTLGACVRPTACSPAPSRYFTLLVAQLFNQLCKGILKVGDFEGGDFEESGI